VAVTTSTQKPDSDFFLQSWGIAVRKFSYCNQNMPLTFTTRIHSNSNTFHIRAEEWLVTD
jgi:hypothetical protein